MYKEGPVQCYLRHANYKARAVSRLQASSVSRISPWKSCPPDASLQTPS